MAFIVNVNVYRYVYTVVAEFMYIFRSTPHPISIGMIVNNGTLFAFSVFSSSLYIVPETK